MRHPNWQGMALATLLLWVGCRPAEPSQADTGAGTTAPLAIVNGEPVFERDYRAFVTLVQGDLSGDPGPTPDRELFREFVANRLLLQEARRQGVTVSEEQVQHYVQTWIPRGRSVTPEFSDQVYDFLVAQQLLKEKAVTKTPVTLRELQAYYNSNSAEFQVQDQVHVLEILTEDQNTATRIRSRLQDGDFSHFREAARLYSVGVMAESGGDLGVYQRGELPEEFERLIFGLRPGQISEPFQSGHGYHLFMVEEKVPKRVQRFHEVRDDIFQTLTAAREREGVDKYITELLQRAEVTFLDPALTLDEVSKHESN